MSVTTDSLNLCKRNLVDALGDKQTRYFQHMKDWFRGRVTKEQFDSEARDLLHLSTVHLHNEFLLAILTKCQLFTTTTLSPPLTAAVNHTTTATTTTAHDTSSHRTSYFVTSSNTIGSSSSTTVSSSYTSSYNNSSNINPPDDIFSSINNADYNDPPQYHSSATSSLSNNAPLNSSSGNSYTSSNSSNSNTLFSNTYSQSSNIATTKSLSNSNDVSNSSNIIFNNNSVANNNAIFNSLINSTNNSNNNISRNISYNNNSNNSSNLGTNTNAITINNTSSNISIKVEVPLHSLEGNIMGSNSVTASLLNSSPEKKKNRPPKKKLKMIKQNTEPMFESVSLHSVTPTACLREPHAIREARAGHHTRSHCLLGLGELKGRLLLASWEHGLSTTSDAVVKLLHQAVKQMLQSVMTCVIKSRGGFRVREGRFVHSLGTCPPNPWLRSTAAATDWTQDSVGLPVSGGSEGGSVGERPLLWPTAEAAQQNGAHLMAFAPHHPPPPPPPPRPAPPPPPHLCTGPLHST